MFMGSKSPVLRARDGMVTSRSTRWKRGEPGLVWQPQSVAVSRC